MVKYNLVKKLRRYLLIVIVNQFVISYLVSFAINTINGLVFCL